MSTLLLSEAIALGATLLKRGNYMTDEEDIGCVLQMADVAIGQAREITACSASARYWPWLHKYIRCPQCGAERPANQIIATHLNDMHEWPTEKIADFVRAVEPQPAPEPTIAENQARIQRALDKLTHLSDTLPTQSEERMEVEFWDRRSRA